MPQNIFHIAAGEMHPINLRLILGKVFVVLLLSGLEQNHVPGSNLPHLALEVKMGFPGGHI